MRFYTKQHAHYAGVDLHARNMFLCVLAATGVVVLERRMPAGPKDLLDAIRPFRDDLVLGVECVFTWYWLADLCARENIPFVLGHALYMKAIHGGKGKNDRVDANKIAALLRGGLMPMAYVYPARLRATRDLLRRRMRLSRLRAGLITHVKETASQYNLPQPEKKLGYKGNRAGVADAFSDPSAKKSVELDLALMDSYDEHLRDLERTILRLARGHDQDTFLRLQTVPGIGDILSLVILYEIDDIARFPRVQDFASYCRLIKPERESDGKHCGGASSGKKIGNAHLKWAFSEASALFLRSNPDGKRLLAKLERKHGKPRALSILAHKLGRAVYHMLRRKTSFDMAKFIEG